MIDVASVLNSAADELERHGWKQGTSEGDNGPTCVDVASVLFRRRALNGRSISAWNDAPGRTMTQVIDTLRNAAKTAPTKENA